MLWYRLVINLHSINYSIKINKLCKNSKKIKKNQEKTIKKLLKILVKEHKQKNRQKCMKNNKIKAQKTNKKSLANNKIDSLKDLCILLVTSLFKI